MGRHWYTPFEHDKWKADPGLALCCASTRGVWIEMLGSMMQLGSGKLTGTLAEHARLARLSEADIEAALIELRAHDVAEVQRDMSRSNSVTVTVVSRYLSRLFDSHKKATEQAKIRKRNQRSRQCHANVTVHSNSHSHSQSNTKPPGAAHLPPEGVAVSPQWFPLAGWQGITESDREAWRIAYPACDIDRQLAAMSVWLQANPRKATKSNWRRFIANWLRTAQDRGGDVPSVRTTQGATHRYESDVDRTRRLIAEEEERNHAARAL